MRVRLLLATLGGYWPLLTRIGAEIDTLITQVFGPPSDMICVKLTKNVRIEAVGSE